MDKSPEPVEKSDSETSDIIVEEVEEEQTTKTDSGTDKTEDPSSTDDPKADRKKKIILRAVRLYPLLMEDLSRTDVQEMMALSCKCHVHFYRATDEEKLGRLDLLYSQFEDSELAASTLNDLVNANAAQRDLIPSLLKPTKESYEAGYKPQKASDEELDPKSLVKSGDPRSIYINSVPAGVTSEQLLILFPTATRAHIPVDEHGKSKGIAVVRFKKGSTAKEFYEKTKTVTIEDQELPLYRFSRGQRPEKSSGKKRSPKKKSPTKQVVSKAKYSSYGGRSFGVQNRNRMPGRGGNMGLLGVAPNYNYLNFQECLQNELQHHMQEMRHDMQLQLHMETQRMRNAAQMHRQYEQERCQQMDNQKVVNQKKQPLKNKTTPPQRPSQTTPRRRQDMAGDRSYSNWADYYEGYGPGQSSITQYPGYSRGMYPGQEYEYMPAGIHDAARWNNNNRQQRGNKNRSRGGVYNNMSQSFYNYNGGF